MSVYPSSGVSLDNIEIRCQMTLSSSSTPSPSNYDNAYLSVRTDYVRPSGILLMVDHYSNNCRINRAQYLHVDVCNRTLILIRINHTILNDTLHKIDYWCNKGEIDAFTSYRITSKTKEKRTSIVIDRVYLFRRSSHSSEISPFSLLLLFVIIIIRFCINICSTLLDSMHSSPSFPPNQ